jgi:hypothetical protein
MAPVTLICRAWMLDTDAVHSELADLLDAPPSSEGLGRLAERAAEIWASRDPIVLSYLELLPADPAVERGALWSENPPPPDDEHRLVEWYRVLMAPYLIPSRAFHAPELLRRRLPDLGWTPSEARRLAFGRELHLLAENHAPDAVGARLRPHFSLGTKGWLGHDDVESALVRFRGLDRHAFRGRPDLVPLVENAYEVLEAAATKPDHVLLLLAA